MKMKRFAAVLAAVMLVQSIVAPAQMVQAEDLILDTVDQQEELLMNQSFK